MCHGHRETGRRRVSTEGSNVTRVPRAISVLPDHARTVRARPKRGSRRKQLACLGAGLAIAGVGAGTAASFGLAASPAMVSTRPQAAVLAKSRAGTPRPVSATTGTQGRVTLSAKISQSRLPEVHGGGHPARPRTWLAVERVIAGKPATGHAALPAADRLMPAGTTGPQSWLPMTPARYGYATTIVRQALDKKMGLRSAVIAVATAMQESALLNVSYGTSDSVGLFQQRPSAGWGTAGQILHPAYAADAFFGALRRYQAANPGWARQPLWQTAQGVQASGYPTAYAKWEAQAASVVSSVARQIFR
jgi:hypothetical protein